MLTFCKVVNFLELFMKIKYVLFLLFCGLLLLGNQRSFKIKSKFSHLKLVDEWIFLSMETITYNEEEEREVVMRGDKNVETLSFHRSGSMSFVSINNGKEKKGRGLWLVKDENIRIIALKDTIDAIYNIDNGILTLTTSEKETDEFYGFTSIVKYKKN